MEFEFELPLPEDNGIESLEGVSGGEPCIAGTRIPVWLIVQTSSLGASDDEILESYPTLTSTDLANVLAYYEKNKEEIREQILENESA
jgi:uncharacterized protein (DUF433 family)